MIEPIYSFSREACPYHLSLDTTEQYVFVDIEDRRPVFAKDGTRIPTDLYNIYGLGLGREQVEDMVTALQK